VKPGWLQALPAPAATLATVGIMIGLYGVDKSLASLETKEVNAEARGRYVAGRKLLDAGKSQLAVEDLRRAHSLNRTNREFELALAEAQLAAGRPEDAEQTLQEALESNSNGGRANLLMARVRMAQDRFDDAIAFYHRATYGSWADKSGADRTKARLELADQLAKRDRPRELLAEVLLLDNAAQGDPALAKKVAALYLEAGSAARAEAAYRMMVRENPKDADAYEGLGQAELRMGEYRAAHSAFTAALRYRPDDPEAALHVRLADRLAELDPTSRRLGSEEKFRRSQEILYLAENETLDCLKGRTVPNQLHDLLAAAAKLRGEKISKTPSNEAAEARLEVAVQLWKERLQACGNAPSPDDPLPIVIRKVEQ
jgi:tetratricopeptide (TPR) repeat protein